MGKGDEGEKWDGRDRSLIFTITVRGSDMAAQRCHFSLSLCALFLSSRCLDVANTSDTELWPKSCEQDVAFQHISSPIHRDKPTSCKTGGGR